MRRLELKLFCPISAAFYCAAFIVLVSVLWLGVTRVSAQAPLRVEGQLINGTGDAPASSVAGIPVTLFQITPAGPVTRTVNTDASGRFEFTDILTSTNSLFTRVDYQGIRYFSDIRPADFTVTEPLSLTVYEASPLPSDLRIARAHLIFEVQPTRLNGLVLLGLLNPTDRAFLMPLPLPQDAVDVTVGDVREQSRLVRKGDGSVLYPILPTTTEVSYELAVPTGSSEYTLRMPIAVDIDGLNLLVSQVGNMRISGAGVAPGETFVANSGQPYLVASAGPQRAGTTFTVTFSNLPVVQSADNTRTLVLVVGALGAAGLLAYPFVRRRKLGREMEAADERVTHLQAIAQLDDAFAAGELEEDEYLSERAALKAELLSRELTKGNAKPQ